MCSWRYESFKGLFVIYQWNAPRLFFAPPVALSSRPSRRAHAPPTPAMHLLQQQLLLRPCSTSVLTLTCTLRTRASSWVVEYFARRERAEEVILCLLSHALSSLLNCTDRCILIHCADTVRRSAASIAPVHVLLDVCKYFNPSLFYYVYVHFIIP